MPLPPFTDDGVLPVGDHPLTLSQLATSHLVTGEHSRSSAWDREWRAELVGNLTVMVRQLHVIAEKGIRIGRIYINGSFVEDKAHPNDIDGYFECRLVDHRLRRIEAALNLLDPHQVWTWDLGSRRWDPGSQRHKLPMWHIYRVELFPIYLEVPNQPSGILDASGQPLSWEECFRLRRGDYKPKGIVQIIKEVDEP
jgi:hypothetical protein